METRTAYEWIQKRFKTILIIEKNEDNIVQCANSTACRVWHVCYHYLRENNFREKLTD